MARNAPPSPKSGTSGTPGTPGTPAPRSRLSGADRRASIVAAAKSVFAANGYDGAKTLQIANAAGVSEALVYRHFPSKAALYRAVLRRLIQEQDEVMAGAGVRELSGAGLLDMIVRSVRHAMQGASADNAQGMRLMFASLAADGSHARLIYRRAKRLVLSRIRLAMKAAAAAGELEANPIDPENVTNFVEHTTSMIQMMHLAQKPVAQYPGDDKALLADAVRFCARGIGLRSDFVESALAAELATQVLIQTR